MPFRRLMVGDPRELSAPADGMVSARGPHDQLLGEPAGEWFPIENSPADMTRRQLTTSHRHTEAWATMQGVSVSRLTDLARAVGRGAVERGRGDDRAPRFPLLPPFNGRSAVIMIDVFRSRSDTTWNSAETVTSRGATVTEWP